MLQSLGLEPFQHAQRGRKIGDGTGQSRRGAWEDALEGALMRSSLYTQEAMASEGKPSRQQSWRDVLLWVVLALLLRWFVLEPRWIPSGSMLPTLELQDRILVEKIRPKMADQRHHPLGIGNVVVFAVPDALIDAGYDPNTALIKRVVAGPGDTVEVREGRLWRNGETVNEPWRGEAMDYVMPAQRVPPGTLWVLGDNRNASLDSHLWGPLPQERVIGTAVWRYWPLNRFGPIRFPLQTGSGDEQGAGLRSGS